MIALYLLSAIILAVLAIHPGRLGLISRFSLAPDLLFLTCDRYSSIPPPKDIPNPWTLPPPEPLVWPDGSDRPPAVLYRRTEDVDGVVLVSPAGGGNGLKWAANVSMHCLNDRLGIVGYQYRRHGDDGPFDIASIPADAEAAWQLVTSRFPGKPIVLFGVSLGCGPSLFLGAQHPEQVSAVVLDSPGDLKWEIHRRGWLCAIPPLFFLTSSFFSTSVPDALDQEACALRLPSRIPVLIASHSDDGIVDPAFASRLAALLGPRAILWRDQGRGHPFVIGINLNFAAEVRSFLSRLR